MRNDVKDIMEPDHANYTNTINYLNEIVRMLAGVQYKVRTRGYFSNKNGEELKSVIRMLNEIIEQDF